MIMEKVNPLLHSPTFTSSYSTTKAIVCFIPYTINGDECIFTYILMRFYNMSYVAVVLQTLK